MNDISYYCLECYQLCQTVVSTEIDGIERRSLCCQAECCRYNQLTKNEKERVDFPLENFYLTFGQKYRFEDHPTFSEAHPDGYVLIRAESKIHSREIAFIAFNDAWAFLYSEDEMKFEHFPMGCLKEMS